MKLSAFIPVIAAIVAAIAVIITNAIQRYSQFKADRRQRLIESYKDLLAGMAELRSTMEVKNFLLALQNAWLFASDEVINLCQEYIDTIAACVFIDRNLQDEKEKNPELGKVKMQLQQKAASLDGFIALETPYLREDYIHREMGPKEVSSFRLDATFQAVSRGDQARCLARRK